MSVSSQEIAEWAAYYRINPFGSYRSDLQTGIIVSHLLSPHLKKGVAGLKPEDFMPKFVDQHTPSPSMTPQQILAMIRARFGGPRRG